MCFVFAVVFFVFVCVRAVDALLFSGLCLMLLFRVLLFFVM